MKFVSLGRKRAQRDGNRDKVSREMHECFSTATTPHQIHTYAELRQQIHDELRIQHPEWVQSDGKCPMCDAYEARLLQLLGQAPQDAHAASILDPRRLLAQGAS